MAPDADDRYLVVDGRRWRRQDPAIPAPLAAELVAELMDARRAVKTARGDEEATATARRRVQAAKEALGERGAPWWEERSDATVATRATAAMAALLTHRGAERSICPSEVARVVDGADWRRWMDVVRDVARTMVRTGDIVVTQRGEPLDPDVEWRGPVRIRRP